MWKEYLHECFKWGVLEFYRGEISNLAFHAWVIFIQNCILPSHSLQPHPFYEVRYDYPTHHMPRQTMIYEFQEQIFSCGRLHIYKVEKLSSWTVNASKIAICFSEVTRVNLRSSTPRVIQSRSQVRFYAGSRYGGKRSYWDTSMSGK